MKNIIITGTSRGIGFELLHNFFENGHRVLALSRNDRPVKNLHFDNVHSFPFDLGNQDDYLKVEKFIKEDWKHVDILIQEINYYREY